MSDRKKSYSALLLFAIITVGAVLRFWDYRRLPYMPDELSALGRAQYKNVNDLLLYGVLVDGHPPGVQLLIYYTIKFFGDNEMIVKLPFLVCGVLSIFCVYVLAKKWFNTTVGLIAASFMATMQYFIMFSQIARPYSTGVFLCLLMVICWSNFLFDIRHKRTWLLGYVLSATCCAYNHHFSLLFAIIVGLTGVFFLTKATWKPYILAGVLIFILYIPNLSAFFFQFSKGGVGGPDGWLGKPDSSWLYRYFQYTLHFSYWMYLLVFILILLSAWLKTNADKVNKYRVICVSWFLVTFLIQFSYSVFRNPVLQFSTLIFVFPFLLMFLFSFFRDLNFMQNAIVVFFVLFVGSLTLILQRKHYQIFYKQPYEQEVVKTNEWLNKIGNDQDVTIQLSVPLYLEKFVKEHYFKKFNRKFNDSHFEPLERYSAAKIFRAFVATRKTNYFIAGGMPPEYLQIIKEFFPYIMDKDEGFTYSQYCFSKKQGQDDKQETVLFSEKLLLNKNTMDSTIEFGQSFSFKLKDLTNTRHAIIIASVDLLTEDSLSSPVLVVNIQDKDSTLSWSGASYHNYNNSRIKPNKLYLCKALDGFDFNKHPEAEVKIYIWNNDKKQLLIDNMRLEVIKGNPFIYALFEPID